MPFSALIGFYQNPARTAVLRCVCHCRHRNDFFLFFLIHHSFVCCFFLSFLLSFFSLAFVSFAFSGHVFRRGFVCILQTKEYKRNVRVTGTRTHAIERARVRMGNTRIRVHAAACHPSIDIVMQRIASSQRCLFATLLTQSRS